MFPSSAYQQEDAELVAGNRVIVVTDGITECIPTDFDRVVANIDSHVSASHLCASIFHLSESDEAVPPTADWDDDRTVLVMAVD
jgi:hypothetical protein